MKKGSCAAHYGCGGTHYNRRQFLRSSSFAAMGITEKNLLSLHNYIILKQLWSGNTACIIYSKSAMGIVEEA
jgi:hypothetical protein